MDAAALCSILKAQQFEISFPSVASAPKLEDLNKVDTFLDHTQIVQNSIFWGYKCQSALQSTLTACWLVAQHKPDMHFVSGGAGVKEKEESI